MLPIEIGSGHFEVPLAENICVETEQVVRQDLELSCHFSAVHLEACFFQDELHLLI